MSTILSREVVPSTSEQQTLPGPVVRSAFVYEAADIRPGMTINEYRSERAGNRHKRELHGWLRRLLSPERRPAGIRRLRQGSRRCGATRTPPGGAPGGHKAAGMTGTLSVR